MYSAAEAGAQDGSGVKDLLGVLYLDSRSGRSELTDLDSGLLHTIATEAALLLENATLVQEEMAARQYREELLVASEIQRGLMSVRIPELFSARRTFSSADPTTAWYVSEVMQLAAGERMLVPTDGVTEAEDRAAELFGSERLRQLFETGATLDAIFDAISAFTGGTPAEDDCTMVEVRYGAT